MGDGAGGAFGRDQQLPHHRLVRAGDGGGSQPPEAPESPPEEDDTATAEAFHLYTMAAMPENASLEQRNLGFPHCTPVLGHLTSTFGWREHPVEGGSKFHYGVDLAATKRRMRVSGPEGPAAVLLAGRESSSGRASGTGPSSGAGSCCCSRPGSKKGGYHCHQPMPSAAVPSSCAGPEAAAGAARRTRRRSG